MRFPTGLEVSSTRPRPASFFSRSLLIAIVLFVGLGATDSDDLLSLGQARSSMITAGESHTYRLRLAGDRFVRLYAIQKDVDLTLRLYAPDGTQVASAEGPEGTHGSEVLIHVCREPGEYRLVVEAVKAGAEGGRYDVGLGTDEPAGDDAEDRAAAMRAYVFALQSLNPEASTEQLRDALASLEEAGSFFRRTGDPLLGWVLMRAADAHLNLDEAKLAGEKSRNAIEIFTRHDDDSGRLHALGTLARAQEAEQQPDLALQSYGLALELAERLDDPASAALTLNNRGHLRRHLGDLARAKSDLEAALKLWREEAADSPHSQAASYAVTTMINLGVVHRQLGEMEQALSRYEQAFSLAQETDWRSDELHLFSNLGRYYTITGDLERARRVLQRGIELAVELERPRNELALSHIQGTLFRILGQHDAAITSFRHALDLSHRIGRPDLGADSLFGLGKVHRDLDQLEKALALFHQAQQVARQSHLPILQAISMREVGLTQARLGDPLQGLDSIRRSLELVADAPAPLRAENLTAEADVLVDLGRTDQARASLRQALDLNLELDDPLTYGLINARLARIEDDAGNLALATDHYAEALGVHEELRTRLVSPDHRASFLAHRRHHYAEMVDLLLRRSAATTDPALAARALEISERSRGRVLVELMTEAQADIRQQVDQELIEQEKDLQTRLSLLQSELLEAAIHDDQAALNHYRAANERALKAYREIELRIREEHADYAALRYPEPMELSSIQALLPPRTALLEYVLGEKRSHLLVVRSSELNHYTLPAAADLRKSVHDVREASRSRDPRSAARLKTASNRLYRWLLAPASEALSHVEQVWIVADGELYYLPFELLTDDRGRYVIGRWTIGYAPSATVLGSLHRSRHRPDGTSFVAFAAPTDGVIGVEPVHDPVTRNLGLPSFQPLPGSEDEVRKIAALFPDDSRLYLGPDANKGNVIDNREVEHARWLHFASHGWIDEDEPARSSLILSPDSKGDTLLPTFEIFNLKLQADAVVLSACDTGLGEEVGGEGLVGFSRAFFYAGASNVVVSLWEVDDRATAELMERFYRGLSGDLAPAAALREAKLTLQKETAYVHPRHWAPFILVGELRETKP